MAAFNRERVPERIKMRHVYHCHKANSSYGRSLADALGLDCSKVERLLNIPSLEELLNATSEEGYQNFS